MSGYRPLGTHPIGHELVSIPTGGGPATYTFSVSGGITFSGTAPNIRERAVLPSGGVTFGGTAPVTDTSEYQFSVSGGITFSGSPVITKENVVTPSGGANFGGTARLIFVPVGGVGSNDSDRISVGVSRKVGVS